MQSAAVLYVNNLEPVRWFYQTCFGLTVADMVEGDYCVLESDAWSLAIVAMPVTLARTVRIADPPDRREQTPVKLAFDVPSIDDLRAAMPEVGGMVDPADREREFRGFRLCDSVDPEGNVVQLRMRLDQG